jgi:hypothetical protein
MRRLLSYGLIASAVVGLLVISIGSRPRLKAEQAPAAISSNAVAGAFGGGDPKDEPSPPVKLASNPMTIAETKVRLKLQEKVTFAFANEISLLNLVKFVEEKTVDKVDFPDGIPIYVDPQGLQDADKTMASTMSIELKGMPLATSLRLALKQLGLDFWVNPDGLLIISYMEDEDMPVDAGKLMIEELVGLRHEIRALRNEIRFIRGVEPLPHQGPGEPRQTPAMGAAGGMR